ncbi:hypothetical protein SNE40_017825 [Patella caerulea]|uniref:DUF4371 domain-containing protein n=1 Tax=Patella caerulea TaxID=87958 RepID=A0AAN8JF47_PATCE
MVEGTILKEAQSSPTFSIMVDEIADITSKIHLAVCVKYLSNEYGTCKTAFLADVELADGTADVITNNIVKILEDKNL